MHNVSDMHTLKGKKKNQNVMKAVSVCQRLTWGGGAGPTCDRFNIFFKWKDWIRVQGGASESSAQSRTWREPVRKKIAFLMNIFFSKASPSYNTWERSPVQARCSTANIFRAIKVINVGFCYCFLIAKTEEPFNLKWKVHLQNTGERRV